MENQTPQQNPVNTGQANVANNNTESQPQVKQVNPQMATNIPDLENGQGATQSQNNQNNQNNPSQPEDMFEGIPSMSDQNNDTPPPQVNANEPLRPQKKSSNFLTILFIVIVIIALLGGVVLAYNFWVNSSSEGEDINTLEESEEFVETEEEIGSFDETYDDDIEFDITDSEEESQPEENIDTEEEVVEDQLGVTEDISEILNVSTGSSEVDLPPIDGEYEVLDYEEENEDLNVEDLPNSINDLLGDETEDETSMENSNEENIEEDNTNEEEMIEDPDGDIDEDGLTNAEEEALGTNLYKADTDNDGLDDREEVMVYDTDPLNDDSDGDGYLDGEEVANGYNPNGEGALE